MQKESIIFVTRQYSPVRAADTLFVASEMKLRVNLLTAAAAAKTTVCLHCTLAKARTQGREASKNTSS